MRSLSALTAASAALLAGTVTGQSSADSSLPQGVVQWPIERRDATTLPNGGGVALRPRRRGMPLAPVVRRDGQVGATFEEVVTNERFRGGYFSTTKVGTPGQALTLQLDTGSSDIWVPYSGAQVCQRASRQSNGCSFGSCA